MKRATFAVVLSAALLAAGGAFAADPFRPARLDQPARDYPTVRELEAGLRFAPGAQIPRIVPARGRGWAAFYLGGRYLGGGVYQVRIKLREEQ